MTDAARIRSHMSSKGQVVIPKALRDSKGIGAGSEVEFFDHPEGLLMKTRHKKRYTLEDLLNVLPPFKGSPITDEVMRENMEEAMRERWARKEKNSRP